MNTTEQHGHDFASGVALYCLGVLVWAVVIFTAVAVVGNLLEIGVDDSDVSAWNRSGLKVHLDAKTGIEYLSDGKGGLVRRETQNTP